MTIPEDFECVSDALDWKPGDPAPSQALARIRSELTAAQERHQALAAGIPKLSNYDQGFRDALLTVKARLTAIVADPSDTQPLAHLERNLNALIDRTNVDFWKVFAVASVELVESMRNHLARTAHEAEFLRAALRAPSGVLIDSAGYMFFVRLNGTDYDTGVLSLLQENDQLRAKLREAMKQDPDQPELMTITVNGIDFRVVRGASLTYEVLAGLVGHKGSALTYQGEGDLGKFSGVLTPGGSLVVPPGTVFKIA